MGNPRGSRKTSYQTSHLVQKTIEPLLISVYNK